MRHESEAYREFMAVKPSPPEHAAYMARAAEMWPDLPGGAQQNALHCRGTLGMKMAARYVAAARARQRQNAGDLQSRAAVEARAMKPYHYEGVATDKRRREYKAYQARFADYLATEPKTNYIQVYHGLRLPRMALAA